MRGGSWLGPWLIVAACLCLLYALIRDPRYFAWWWQEAWRISGVVAAWVRDSAAVGAGWLVARPRSIRLVIARRHIRERTS